MIATILCASTPPQFYVHRYDTYMYSNVLMAFNTPLEVFFRESSNILYGEHHAMYPRYLHVEDCEIVGSLLYSHNDMQLKWCMDFLSQLSRYHMKAQWKEANARPERGKERLCLWHVKYEDKDKLQVTRFLEFMYNANHRKLFTLGYKLRFLFDDKELI
jgi:hypothetical protein